MQTLAKNWGAWVVLASAVGFLTGAKILTVGPRLDALEARVSALELRLNKLDALALIECIRTDSLPRTYAYPRALLRCSER